MRDLRSNTENQTSDESDQFRLRQWGEGWLRSVGPRTRTGLWHHRGEGLVLRPSRKAAANENASTFGMRNLSIGSHHLLSQHFVCFGGGVRQR